MTSAATTTQTYADLFSKFVDKHFDTAPEPTRDCMRMVDIYRMLFAHSYNTCPDGCGLTVPYIPTAVQGLELDFFRHCNNFQSFSIRGLGRSKYTNLQYTGCAAPQ